MRLHGLIDGQWDVDEDFAQEEKRTGVASKQQGVLASPAQAGFARQLDFHERRGIRKDAVLQGMIQRTEYGL